MQRSIEVTASPALVGSLLPALLGQEHVVGVVHHRGVSAVPPGDDVLVVHALNRGADAVMQAIASAAACHPGPVSVATSRLASLSDPGRQHDIDRDVDEALWEEMETGLRHQGRLTANFLMLMALGGVIAAAGLLAHDAAGQIVASIAAAILAPGFEPIAKVPLGLVLRRFEVVKLGLASTCAGFAVLMAGGAAAFWMLHAFGAADPATLPESSAFKALADPPAADLLVSVCGAFAGLLIQASYRNSVIAGALVAMRLIDAAAAVRVALSAGMPVLALQALERFGLDAGLIMLPEWPSSGASSASCTAGRHCTDRAGTMNARRMTGKSNSAALPPAKAGRAVGGLGSEDCGIGIAMAAQALGLVDATSSQPAPQSGPVPDATPARTPCTAT